MKDIDNQPINVIENYSSNNDKFIQWVTETVTKDNYFEVYKTNTDPWTSFDLILIKTIESAKYWYIFKKLPKNITIPEVHLIIDKRAQILKKHSSFFKNCDGFIFIFVSHKDEYPIDLNIGRLNHNRWSQVFSTNLFISTRNGESTYVKVPKRFKIGLEYLDKKIIVPFKKEISLNPDKYKSFAKEEQNKQKISKIPDLNQENSSHSLKIDREQLLVRLKGILKIHSKVTLAFVAQKLDIDKKEVEDLIYEASGQDQLDIKILEDNTIVLKK